MLLIAVVIASRCTSVGASYGVIQPYREAANWLYTQSDTIFDPKTIALTGYSDGWAVYYASRKGRRDQAQNADAWLINEERLLLHNRVYVFNFWAVDRFESALNKHYSLEQDLPKIQMKVYVKK